VFVAIVVHNPPQHLIAQQVIFHIGLAIKCKCGIVARFGIVDSETVKYTPIDSIVSFACYSDIGDCVERHLQIDNQKVYRKRVAIRVADKKNAQDVVTEIKALILALQFK
jgi:hypothetical protein